MGDPEAEMYFHEKYNISVVKENNIWKIVVWTTTPWTLSSNVALAVNPEIDYVKVKVKSDDKFLIMGRNALKMIGDDKIEVVDSFKGDISDK